MPVLAAEHDVVDQPDPVGDRQHEGERRRTGSNSSIERTKPLKKTEASRSSSDSWTAWRSESETTAMSRPSAERGEQQHRRRSPRRARAGSPSIGTWKATTSRAMVRPRSAPPMQPEGEDLAGHDLAGRDRRDRNSSMTPLVRSRTSDRAISVTARCWRISARTAGPKKATTRGSDGATLTTSARVGAATTSGGICRRLVSPVARA